MHVAVVGGKEEVCFFARIGGEMKNHSSAITEQRRSPISRRRAQTAKSCSFFFVYKAPLVIVKDSLKMQAKFAVSI